MITGHDRKCTGSEKFFNEASSPLNLRLRQVRQGIRRNRYGSSGKKIGNAYLTWAFSEAAVLFLRNHEAGQKYLVRLAPKHGQGKALTILAHKLARVVYYMLKRDTAFDMDIFMQREGRGGDEPGGSLDD